MWLAVAEGAPMNEFFKGLKQGFRSFGELIGMVVNSALLLVAYIIGVGITSIIAKITGKHFLEMKLDKKSDSYWKPFQTRRTGSLEDYRQF